MAAATYEVLLTRGAQADLEGLHAYLCEHASLARANALLDALLERVERLEHFPGRGAIPKELSALGIREFRQLVHPPYRLIYRTTGSQVVVMLIADGRRDMQTLLSERLLRGFDN